MDKDQSKKINKDNLRSIIREYAVIIFNSVILFLSAGTLAWLNAWIYIIAATLLQVFLQIMLYLKNPQLLEERGKLIRKGTTGYDKIFVIFYFFAVSFLSIVSGLDAVRFQCSHMPFVLVYPGLIILILSSLLGTWAMVSNPFFAGTQRIQKEKKHRVVQSGPYKYVRHPGYISWILAALSYPLILGSLYAVIIVSVMILVFIARTAAEDWSLINKLDGYREYAKKVKYRLLPYIW